MKGENITHNPFFEESTDGNNSLSVILEDNYEDGSCLDRSVAEISKKMFYANTK